MAHVTNSRGRRTLAFTGAGGKRYWTRLGQVSKKDADVALAHVERLEGALHGLPVPQDTLGWLASVGGRLHAALARAGLCRPRAAGEPVELAAMLDAYIARRTDTKKQTRTNLTQARDALVRHFKPDRDLARKPITLAEAKDWRRWLGQRESRKRGGTEAHAPATASAYVKKARQMFQDAVDRGLIASNPFLKLKAGSQVNAARNVYVPAADVLKVIEACPDVEWKLLLALARFGGVRVPSEIREMKWENLLPGRKLLILSPKTEHHEGKDSRLAPISDDLWQIIREANPVVKLSDSYLLPRLRLGTNHRTTAGKIIRSAGLVPWPRVFQNLRASCETDWAARFPIAVACEWAGNTALVAVKHYLRATDEDFARASKSASPQPAADLGNTHAGGGRTTSTPNGERTTAPGGGRSAPGFPEQFEREGGAALLEALARPGFRLLWLDRVNEAAALAAGGARC